MEVLESWGRPGTEEWGNGYHYFTKSTCVIPEKSRIALSNDGHTVTITAYDDTCFILLKSASAPKITVWTQTRGDVVLTKGNATLSEDRKTITFTWSSDRIYKIQLDDVDTIKFGFAEETPTNAKLNVRYNTSTRYYRFEAYADYGYNFYVDECALEINGSQKGADYVEEEYPTPKHIWWEGGNVTPDTYGNNFAHLDIRTDSSEPLNATITNNLANTSYVMRYGGIMEITSDKYYFPRANAKVLANNTEQTLNVDNDFYYEQKSVMTCDVGAYLATAGTIVLQGDMYHRDWPYCTAFNSGGSSGDWMRVTLWVDEDVLIVKANEGYIFYNDYPGDGTYRVVAYVTRDGVKYFLDPAPNYRSLSINLSAWNTGNDHTVMGKAPKVAPTAEVPVNYNLSHCSSQGTAQQTVSLSGQLLVTLVADYGYQFNTAPTVKYIDGWGNAQYVPFTVSQDKSTATIEWYPASADLDSDYGKSGSFVVTGTAAVAPPQPFTATIVNNISGTTYSQANDVISVYAPNGYVFSAAPTLDWTNGTNSGTATFTMGSDSKSATINATAWRTSAYTLTIQGAIEEEHIWGPSSITNNVANTTDSLSGTTLTLVCSTGYVFDDAPVIAQAGSAGPITMTLNSSGTIASADIAAYDALAVVISGSTSVIPDPPTPSTNHTVYTRLTNCTGSGIPGAVDDDDTLNITLTANSGYEFDTNYLPSVEYIKSDNLTYREYFTLSSDGSTATITLNTANLGLKTDSALTVVGQAYEKEPTPPGPEPPYSDKYGLVNIYNPTTSELQQFAAQRFRYDQNMMPFDDLGNYVTSLKRVYVTMPASTDTTISAGRYHTTIASRTPVTDIVNLDFGTILLPAHNLDVLDGNSRVSIFLPFVGFVDVNPEFCGSSIALTYQVNIVTGEGVAKLSRNNIVFAIYPCRPSTDMAYRSNTMMSQTLGGSEFNTMYLYGLQPYAIVKWYTSKNQHLLNNDCHRGVIGTYHGYAKFTEVTDINNGQITADEKNLLIRTLASGVYIETNEP